MRSAVDPNPSRGVNQSAEERTIADRQWQMYTRARDAGHLDYIEHAKKCDAFYRGEQWEQSDLQRLRRSGRPALTINKILSTVNTLLGEQSTRRMDIQYKGRTDATRESAFALTQLAMAICDINKFDWSESEVFADGVIEERGYFDIRMGFTRNFQGDAEITVLDPRDVVLDPDAKTYDPEGWKEVFITRWLSIDEIEMEYGEDKAKEVKAYVGLGDTYGPDSIRYDLDNSFGNGHEIGAATVTDADMRDFITAVRVIERQWRKNVMVFSLVDPETGEFRDLPIGTKKEEAEALAMKYQTFMHRRRVRKVRWTVTADHVTLHDDWSPYKSFTVVPYFPYFRRGRPTGVVSNLISPQEQLNKVRSQILHVINTTANSGWKVPTGSLVGMTADELAVRGSETGLVLEYNATRGEPEKIQPNQIPSGLDRVAQTCEVDVKEISGVSDTMLGMESAEVSGVALQSKEGRGQVQMQIVMDNLARTRDLVARKLMELMQAYYTNTRRITIDKKDDIGGMEREEMVINEPQSDGSITNDITIGEYDVAINTLPPRDTYNDTQFAEVLNMRQAGVPIPAYHVVRFSHLKDKDQIAEELKSLEGLSKDPAQQQLMQAQQQVALAAAQAEVAKLQAEADEIKSKATLNRAKTDDLNSTNDARLNELEGRIQMKREEIALRERLAQLQAGTSLNQTMMSGQAQLATASLQAATQKEVANRQARKETNPKTKKKGDK
ncbi:genomic island protein [Parendozoicomonas haliclonae]|uniref:portal protein n=1 Tax=Parendozoicomonas haliclonae TaxID=1960125 RepID=UPI001056C493|nr:genomic island protein [Parendozoicomonas haliclonae]